MVLPRKQGIKLRRKLQFKLKYIHSCKGIMKLNLLRKYNYNCNNKYQPKRKGSQLYLANKNNSSFNKTKFIKKDNSHFNLFHKCFNITPLKKISIL